MAIQSRFTVSALWNGSILSVLIDATSSEHAARIALEKNFPKHESVWVYNWLFTGDKQIRKYNRAERGKVKEIAN